MRLFCLVLLLASACQAGTIFVQTTFTNANQVYTYTFTTLNESDLNIQTWSYGGGTSATGAVVPEGGFDPVVSLFLGSGPGALLLDSNDDGSCPPGNLDSVTFACLDATLNETALSPGTYTVAFTVFANLAIGPTFGNGFTNEGDFTDIFGDLRSAFFAADVTTTTVSGTPEPSYLVPVLLLGGLAAFYRRRQ